METIEPPGSSSNAVTVSAASAPTFIGAREPTYQHATSALVVALVINFVIAGIKFLAWLLSRSPSMLSECLHSLGDGVNSIALLIGIRLSSREPDPTHPFGYGLEASVWAIPACAFLLIFSLVAVWEGWKRLWHPEWMHLAPGWEWLNPYYLSVLVLVISILLEIFAVKRAAQAVLEEFGLEAKGLLSTLRQGYQHIGRVVGPTTRFVFYEENIALLGATLALIAITLSHYAEMLGWLPAQYAHWPDSIASILIGFMLMGMSVYLFIHNRGILTQTSASPNVERKIRDLVMSMQGISELLDLKTIDHGIAGLTVHLKVQVDPYIQVKDVDDLTERVKERIGTRIGNVNPAQVFVEVLADESEIEWGEKFNTLIEQGRTEGVLDARAESLLKNVYDFTECTARDIMIPRIDVEYVELQTPLSEVADLIIETGHSRLPVFKEDVDDLVGLVHARDVFDRIRKNQVDTPLAEIVREIDIYPENKPVSDLLEDFKRNKIRIAAVADEHGGFSGLVTVEDVIEEIIGEIWDEHEDDEPMWVLLAPNRVQVNGRCEVEDLNEQLDINLPFDDFKTVGGYVFGALGREPEPGDGVPFEDLQFTVEEVDGPRIVSVILESPVPFRRETETPARSGGHGTAEDA